MNKQNRTLLCVLSLLTLICWTACSKSNNNNSNSRAALIAQASWKYDTSGIDLNADGIVDIGDTTFPVCQKQYTYLFKLDSTGVITAGAIKCHPTDPATVNFTWALTNNQTVLTTSGNPILQSGVNIFSVTASKFILYKDTILLGTSLRYVFSLKH